MLENDQTDSNVDDTEQQMIVASDNAACSRNLQHSQQPAQHCTDHTHQTIALSQDQEMVKGGPQAHGDVQLKDAASAK